MTEPETVKKTKLKDYLKELESRINTQEDTIAKIKEDNERIKQYNAELSAERKKTNEDQPTGPDIDPDDWDLEDL